MMNQLPKAWQRDTFHWLAFGALVLATAILFGYNYLYGERIQFNGGLGWDGAAYADWARRSPANLLGKRELSEYYIGRILPPILVHYFAKFFGLNLTSDLGVIRAFYIYNCLCIAVGAIALLDVGRVRQWSRLNAITVVSLVFINYAVMKNMSYNPTLTDMTALAAACLLADALARNSVTGLMVVGFASCFIWPSFLFVVIPLIAFQGARGHEGQTAKWLPPVCSAVIASALVGGTVYAYWQGFRPRTDVNQLNSHLLWLSAPIAIAFLFTVLKRFADPYYFLSSIRTISVVNVVYALGLYLAVKGTTLLFSNGDPGPLTPGNYLPLIILGGMVNPGLNLVAHLTHFGPIISIALILWSDIERRVRQSGPGLVMLFGTFGFLAIGTESRQFIPFIPFIGVLIGDTLSDERRESWTGYWYFTVIAFALSRFWLTINVAPWTGNYLEFPDQMLYMYTGPWMSNTMYSVFLWICIIVAVASFSIWQAFYRCSIVDHNKKEKALGQP